MIKRMRKISTALALLALCAPLGAQNINQTVEVTNDYRTRFADFQKQGPGMTVPDSLFRFDYDFDYSVFETPYRGSYEFSPYRIEVTPEARGREGNRLYLRAGAGFTFHPQLEFAARLLDKEDFKIGLVADMHGYAGQYRLRDVAFAKAPCYDLSSGLALNGQYLRPKARLSYQFGLRCAFCPRRNRRCWPVPPAYAALGRRTACAGLLPWRRCVFPPTFPAGP